jgi:hypothetical protein
MREFILHIDNENKIVNPKVVREHFSRLNQGKYLITIKNIKNRSNQQNRYLHGIIIPLVFEGLRNAGFDDVKDFEDAKLVIKALFLKRKITNEQTGEVIEIIKDTRKLTTVEMNQFIEEVAKWCSEYLGFVLPMPTHLRTMEFF